MLKSRIVLGVILVVGLIVCTYAANNPSEEKNGLLRHVVCFKFTDNAAAEQIKTVEDAFAALPDKIPFIVAYEAGTNVSPENRAKGFTHCFILTFKTAKDRDAYLTHPAHKEFGKSLGGILDDVFVLDFWTK